MDAERRRTLHLQIKIDLLRLGVSFMRMRLQQQRSEPMTPKLQGVASAMAMLRHELDDRADKFMARVESTRVRTAGVFAQAHGRLDAAHGALDEVDAMLDEVANTNGGPTLDASSPDSAGSAPAIEAQAAAAPLASESGRVARCRWHGAEFLAEPIIQVSADGTWRMRTLERHPRFAPGTFIMVRPDEIITLDIKDQPHAQA